MKKSKLKVGKLVFNVRCACGKLGFQVTEGEHTERSHFRIWEGNTIHGVPLCTRKIGKITWVCRKEMET